MFNQYAQAFFDKEKRVHLTESVNLQQGSIAERRKEKKGDHQCSPQQFFSNCRRRTSAPDSQLKLHLRCESDEDAIEEIRMQEVAHESASTNA